VRITAQIRPYGGGRHEDAEEKRQKAAHNEALSLHNTDLCAAPRRAGEFPASISQLI
jgi:hypothetical protein